MLVVRPANLSVQSKRNFILPRRGHTPSFRLAGLRFRVSALGLFYSAFLRPVSAEGHKITCVDISQVLSSRSVARSPRVHEQHQDIREWPYVKRPDAPSTVPAYPGVRLRRRIKRFSVKAATDARLHYWSRVSVSDRARIRCGRRAQRPLCPLMQSLT